MCLLWLWLLINRYPLVHNYFLICFISYILITLIFLIFEHCDRLPIDSITCNINISLLGCGRCGWISGIRIWVWVWLVCVEIRYIGMRVLIIFILCLYIVSIESYFIVCLWARWGYSWWWWHNWRWGSNWRWWHRWWRWYHKLVNLWCLWSQYDGFVYLRIVGWQDWRWGQRGQWR